MSATGSISPRRLRSQSTSKSYQMSPAHPSSKRAFPSAASPLNIGPRGKRARTCASPSPSAFPAENLSEISGSSSAVSIPLEPIATNLVSSAPATPLLPSSSAAFFPASGSYSNYKSSDMHSPSPPSPGHSRTTPDDLHREAFTSLRQSLARSGEGFVRRMRDWERRRNFEKGKVSLLGAHDKMRDKRGARSRRTSHTDHRSVGEVSATHSSGNSISFTIDVSPPGRGSDDISAYSAYLSGHDDSDVEDDMQIDGASRSLPLAPPERKPGRVSLREAIDIPGSPELFAVELAESDADSHSSTRYASAFDFPFTYSNTRSSSPLSLGHSSDDESSAGSRNDQAYSGYSSPSVMSNPVDWSSFSVSKRSHSAVYLQPRECIPQISPGTSPRPPSPGFSDTRLSARCHMIDHSFDDIPGHMHPPLAVVSDTNSQLPQTASDRALAALVLALANGSGSLADYGYVREAQGELEELEAGALWE